MIIHPAAGNASDSFKTNAGAIFSWGSRLFYAFDLAFTIHEPLTPIAMFKIRP